MTRTDIEEALVDLQIKTGVCVHPCETEEDIAVKIASFTKAVAEKPYKYVKCGVVDTSLLIAALAL